MNRILLFFVFTFLANVIAFSLSFPEMVTIPGGEFIMGSNDLRLPSKIDDDGTPDVVYEEHQVVLDCYKISMYEITFKDYFEFLNETDYKTSAELEWLRRNEKTLGPYGFRKLFSSSLYPNYPVTRIAYEDALMYCFWLQNKTGKIYRLPTEAEWEYAATGGQMVLYPWGNKYKQLDQTHFHEYTFDARFDSDIFPINKYTEDRSKFNVYGMYGNALEWCLDAYDPLFYYRSAQENPLQIIRKYYNDLSFRGSAGYSMESGFNNLKRRFFASPLYYIETMGFRIVEEIQPVIFNKNSKSECTYYYANGFLSDSNVNVRDVPSLEGKKLFQLSNKQPVRIYLRSSKQMTIGNMTDYWYCVRRLDTESESEMATGWVFGAFLDIRQIEFKADK